MKLHELIQELQEIQDSLGEGMEAEVLLATQPTWPLAHNISCISSMPDEENEYTDEYEETEENVNKADKTVVWIAEGGPAKHPYAPRDAWT